MRMTYAAGHPRAIVAILSLCAIGSSCAADGDGRYAVLGMGRASCNSFLQASPTAQRDKFKGYVGGHVTAYNALSADTYSVTGDRSFDELMGLIAEYCDRHRMDSFDRAVQRTLADLAPTRQRGAPQSAGGWGRR